MPHIDHHTKPYDEGTINKLEIFERYVETWLPTFIMQKHITEVNIVDFFSGFGYDSNEVAGSPIRTLDKINGYFENLMQNNTIINLYFNEFKAEKFDKLQINCNAYLEQNSRLKQFVKIHYSNKDFNEIYNEIIVKTKDNPNLYIIDQSGIKFTNQKNFNTLLALQKTDFLFFISSSFFKRFSNEDEFNRHLGIKEEDLKANPYNFIHRVVLDKYRSLIPEKSELQIFPFSIKKGANIYGIVFGSKHIVGVEKFLKIAWNKNKINGEADYDIDEDNSKSQLVLNFDNPSETKKLTKIENFEQKLEEFIKSQQVTNNRELYYFTYKNGHIVEHTNNYLRELKRIKKITFSGHTKISWDKVKQNDVVEFRWL
jgi:three-Cys-motif partner protein